MTDFYSKLALYYDEMYREIDYEGHSKHLHEIIQQHKKTSGNKLLDVACGTGTHIKYLLDYYDTSGYDLSDEMLEVARKKCPTIEFLQGDMITLDLGRKFDVITCLFGSISYMTEKTDLAATIKKFSQHTVSGGVVIIEPIFTKETYHEGSLGITCLDLQEIKISRVNATKRDGDIAYLNFHFLISTRESGVEHFIDPSPMGIFSRDTYLSIMQENDLITEFITPGLTKEGLFIGVKR